MSRADRPSPLRVAVIPDSFKGTLDARRVATAIADGVRRAAGEAQQDIIVDELPFADGGEGTLDAVLAAWGTSAQSCATTDAIGRPCDAEYAISADGRIGLIEAAQANGLAAVSDVPLRAAEATTRGVGTLVRAALDEGVDEILLTIGGSATTDAGTGLLRELGARFFDVNGVELPDGGGSLLNLATIDLSGIDPRVREVTWRIATDVTNPLTGPQGAAHVFGPQKGAALEDVEHLDRCLKHLAEVVAESGGKSLDGVAGLGAAGGLGALLYAFFTVELVPGWEMVSDALGAAEKIGQADLVFTGEGRFDTQSLDGKVIHGVRQLTAETTPMIVLAGQVAVDAEALQASGVTAAFSIGRGPGTLGETAPHTAENLTWTAYQVARLLLTP
ncbi:glycerate kinase [Citricoccus sp. NR2]|uniref:glycerate kinase n=1 Tax=Citricoccus sp. NR2 TaxID=3004095 RepID=UPI0022DCFA00|nr:glycerate kinase [Citricoccus sp. NR2]WBL19126.1 glycerate kinase [Citricoccus sp. NR2]